MENLVMLLQIEHTSTLLMWRSDPMQYALSIQEFSADAKPNSVDVQNYFEIPPATFSAFCGDDGAKKILAVLLRRFLL
jgi:hypothetical protein